MLTLQFINESVTSLGTRASLAMGMPTYSLFCFHYHGSHDNLKIYLFCFASTFSDHMYHIYTSQEDFSCFNLWSQVVNKGPFRSSVCPCYRILSSDTWQKKIIILNFGFICYWTCHACELQWSNLSSSRSIIFLYYMLQWVIIHQINHNHHVFFCKD